MKKARDLQIIDYKKFGLGYFRLGGRSYTPVCPDAWYGLRFWTDGYAPLFL